MNCGPMCPHLAFMKSAHLLRSLKNMFAMKISNQLVRTVPVIALLVLGLACTNDVADPCKTSFTHDVMPLMMSSCAYSGCHSGSSASQWVPARAKDYTSYDGMLGTLSDGTFALRVLELQNMPPDKHIPEGRPTFLTGEDLEMLRCWVNDGYPNN